MKVRLEYLVAYDIAVTKTRTAIYNQLLAFGLTPVQKSLCWGFLSYPELNALKRLFTHNLHKTDKALITRVDISKARKVDFSLGTSPHIFQDWQEYGNI